MASSVDVLLKDIGLSDHQIQQVHQGILVKDTVASNSERELGVQLAALVNAPLKALKLTFHTDPVMKREDSSVQLVALIDDANPDFSKVMLDDGIIQAYLKAAPGSDLNLSKTEIEDFQAVAKSGGKKEQVEKQFQEMLLNRYRSYRQKGLGGILPYHRGKAKDFHPGDELAHSIQQTRPVKKKFPVFYEALSIYPNARPEGLEESFFWISSLLDGKTTVSLVHHFGLDEADGYFFCERQYYVSRSHNSVQGVGGAFPVNGDEMIIAYVARTSTDQVSGFGGSAKKAIGAKVMASKIAENFEKVRSSIVSDK
jgi:hypothetical protein